MADAKQLARRLKVLSVPARVRIVQLLRGRALCVNALAARLDITQGAVSQHLRVLRDAGLVTDDKRGAFVHYRIHERALSAWRRQIDTLLRPPAGTEASAGPARKKGSPPCAATKAKSKAARSPRT